MAELDGVEHRIFLNFLGARFDHHDAVARAHDHDVHQTLAHLVVGGIHHELAVHQADPHCTNGAKEGNVGKREGAGRAVDAKYIGIVIGVGGENEGNDLSLALKSLGKHRPHRPVDLAAGEHFAFTHAPFALDKAAGKTSAGIGVFAVVDGEGKEINAFTRVGVGGSGGEDDVVAHADYGCAVGLLGQFSSFKCELFSAGEVDGDGANFWFHIHP